MKTLGHVCESSRAHDQQIRARSVSPHITSLFFMVDRADEDATLCSHARFRACCSLPAPQTMHRIVFVAVDRTHAERSVTRSRSTSR
jgi:hypothetical protein